MNSQKDANAIDTQPLHSRKIFPCCFGIELFPDLRRPASAGVVVVYAKGDEGLAVFRDERTAIFGDENLGEGSRTGRRQRYETGGNEERSERFQGTKGTETT